MQGETTTTFKFSWSEITQAYQSLVAGELKGKEETNRLKEEWETNKNEFYGGTSEEMLDILINGYPFDNLSDEISLPVSTYERPRRRYTDDSEGEFNYDLYANGETEFYLQEIRRPHRGGISLLVQYDFAANVTPENIASYGRWVGAVIQHLQARGYDLEIKVFCLGSYAYEQVDGVTETHIQLSKFGEQVLKRDWSALFSPCGYRHLGFMSLVLPEVLAPNDWTCSRGLGGPVSVPNAVTWKEDTREVRITCDPNAQTNLSVEQMTKDIEALPID